MVLNGQIATNVGPSGIEVAYERRGNPTDPVVLLIICGLGHNLPPGLWERFADHIAECATWRSDAGGTRAMRATEWRRRHGQGLAEKIKIAHQALPFSVHNGRLQPREN